MGERLIPRTSDRLLTDFTRDEREALYEYAIAHTVKPDIGGDIEDSRSRMDHPKNEKEPTYLELLAQERNMKRRRAKHKGVHTNKKSHTEILREVINQQMEMYTERIADVSNNYVSIEDDHTSDKQHPYRSSSDQRYSRAHTNATFEYRRDTDKTDDSGIPIGYGRKHYQEHHRPSKYRERDSIDPDQFYPGSRRRDQSEHKRNTSESQKRKIPKSERHSHSRERSEHSERRRHRHERKSHSSNNSRSQSKRSDESNRDSRRKDRDYNERRNKRKYQDD